MVDRPKLNKSVWILDLIERSGKKGMSFMEIQEALWKLSHKEPYTREQRGYWCTGLYGSGGLLGRFCTQDPKTRRWIRNKEPHNGHPWAGPYQLASYGQRFYCWPFGGNVDPRVFWQNNCRHCEKRKTCAGMK